MSTPFDWLSAAEKCENQVAGIESFSRRHRVRLLLLGGVALACGGLYMVPVLRAHGQRHSGVAAPSPRPPGGASPTWKKHGSSRSGHARRESPAPTSSQGERGREVSPPETSPPSQGTESTKAGGATGRQDQAPTALGPSPDAHAATPGGAAAPVPACSDAPAGPLSSPGNPSTSSAPGASPSGGVPRPGAPRPGSPRPHHDLAAPSPSVPPRYIWVHVAGAVARPGAVRVTPGARAFQAVAAAGGLLPRADLTRVNLARALQDEGIIIVPTMNGSSPTGEADSLAGDASGPSAESASTARTPAGSPRKAGKSLPSSPLDLNTATADQLENLPGVGSAMAQAILDWRQRYGPFRQVRDLLQVPRIGRRMFTRLEPHVRVGNP